ncbi:MAG: MFS transporter [Myxococcota bacterium]
MSRDAASRTGTVGMSVFWFFALGSLGLFFPFFSLYLRENLALSGWQVGMVLAAPPLVAIAAQPFFGMLADRSGNRVGMLALLAIGTGLGHTALAFGEGFAGVLLLTTLLAFFSTPLIPTAMSVTFALTQDLHKHAFGLCRTAGTIGFGLLVVGFPYLLDAIEASRGLAPVADGPSEPALRVMFPAAAIAVVIAGLVALTLPRKEALAVRAEKHEWRSLLRHWPFLRVLAFGFLAYLFMQGPMGIFPLFVRAHGGSLDTVSTLWVWMLVLEVPLILYSGVTLERLGARGVLAVGVGAAAVRWLVCGFAPESWWVTPVQALHGVTVAGIVIGAPLYVEAVVPDALRSTGQNLLALVGVSVGGLLSNLGAGALLDWAGTDLPYQISGVGLLLLLALLPWLLPPPSRIAPEGIEPG